MALLDRLLPAWRHSDPKVRAEAVRDLGRDAQETLATVARRDEDAGVRRLALKKLEDAELLLEIGRTDPDEELRALAAGRAEELLLERALSATDPAAGTRAVELLTRSQHRVAVAVRACDERVRRAALAGLSDERAIADVARRSGDPEVRREALQRITDTALLRRIATGDTPLDAAVAALESLSDPVVLRDIAEDPRAQKPVRKRARALLASVVLDDDHPIRVAERRERRTRLCVTVEGLAAQPDPTRLIGALDEAEREWRDLAARGPTEPELEERFRRTVAAVREAVERAEQRRSAENRREAARRQTRLAREQLCQTVETLEGPETPARLAEARAAWQALGPVDDIRDGDLAGRFDAGVERCERRHERWQARAGFRARLETLVDEAERLLASGDPQAAVRRRAALERRWADIEASPAGRKWMAEERALQERFAAAGVALADRQQADRAERERLVHAARQRSADLLGRLEQLVHAGTIRRAPVERALAAATAALEELAPLPAAERTAYRQRLAAAQQALASRLQEESDTDDWKRWANADRQRELIARAEALLEAGEPLAMLREIGHLEQEWKSVATAPQKESRALWEKFRRARNELRRRCSAYLAENEAKKQALCEAVERLADSTDWNATADAIRRLQADWKKIGPVRQRVSAELLERFRAPANRFFERRKEQMLARKQRRDEMEERRRAVCEAAEGLADSTDWDATAAELRRLQTEWRKAAPPAARGPTPLGDRFRAACDRFFDRYKRRDEIESEARLGEASAVLAALEALLASLADPDPPAPERVASEVGERLAAWGRLGPLPAAKARELNARLQEVCNAIEHACPDGLRGGELDAEAACKQREKLCARLERLTESLAVAGEPEPANLAERLKLALAANTIGGPATPPRERARREAEEEAERLQAKWARLGPVVGEKARALAERFDRAREAFRTTIAR